MALKQRLLHDIADLQQRPYPNIQYHPHKDDLRKGCLILQPSRGPPLHLTVDCGDKYPLDPPQITIQTRVRHPNVFGDYICASILNTTEGYTPAYTLKGICIQMLSFFSSDTIEQTGGGTKVDLRGYQSAYRLPTISRDLLWSWSHNVMHTCNECSFDSHARNNVDRRVQDNGWSGLGNVIRNLDLTDARLSTSSASRSSRASRPRSPLPLAKHTTNKTNIGLTTFPDELLVLICNQIETEDLTPFAQAWTRIGGEDGVIRRFNIIRKRELICFCLKKDFEESQLGVGVRVVLQGRLGAIESEFDLISAEAFQEHNIRRSVHGQSFKYWLPLPLTRRHWSSVRDLADERLLAIGRAARLSCIPHPPDVLYAFMSDIVVKLSTEVANAWQAQQRVLHASEKAVESYFHLFHLLLCLVTTDQSYLRSVNRKVREFLKGKTSKEYVPNLGHLLVMILISDTSATTDLIKAVVDEAVTRNVVWMLDKRGANMPELAYMETNYASEYRLKKTFEASLTSYRLLMFYSLFRRAINRSNKTLQLLRDELFDAYGAPPKGTAERLATQIKELQQVSSFPRFLRVMGLEPPTAAEFTDFLRNSVKESMRRGYSVWGISQEMALNLRRQKDPTVQVGKEKETKQIGARPGTGEVTFFPHGKKRRRAL